MSGSVVAAILGAEWVAFNLIGVHAVARAAAKRVMAWLLAGDHQDSRAARRRAARACSAM